MVFDGNTRRPLLFTSTGETWTWAGSTWHAAASSAQPTLDGFSMAFDTSSQNVVLVGALQTFSGSVHQTWTWNGARWALEAPATSPPVRSDGALAYDPVRQKVVLFGGRDPNTVSFRSDTWEWTGADWAQLAPATAPAGRQNPAVATDLARQRIVLFGGWSTFTNTLSENWDWDGATWVQRFPPSSPSARSATAIAYDASRQRVVMFGGTTSSGASNDTWEFDGTTWLLRSPPHAPSARAYATMAYDRDRQRIILFGGEAQGSRLTDTWAWDGADWALHPTLTAPRLILGRLPRVVYDQARQRTTLFTGGDMWIFLP
ncbi:MAG: hypothetical protein JNG84_07085, partial [Archangium sp.]|nr:hypothetical protein [Archangium sp.]